MDRWLSAIEADHRNVPKAQKVRQDKPADAKDECFAGDQELPASSCGAVYPSYSTPRLEAGEPLRNDNVMCRLKPLRRADYKVTFTAAEWAQLKKAFPTGVCDWSKPAVNQQPAVTWLTYAHGAGGTPTRCRAGVDTVRRPNFSGRSRSLRGDAVPSPSPAARGPTPGRTPGRQHQPEAQHALDVASLAKVSQPALKQLRDRQEPDGSTGLPFQNGQPRGLGNGHAVGDGAQRLVRVGDDGVADHQGVDRRDRRRVTQRLVEHIPASQHTVHDAELVDNGIQPLAMLAVP